LAGPRERVVGDVCAKLLGRAVAAVDRIHGGRNSQVFRVECADAAPPRRFVAKQYFANPEDPRDRLRTEYTALSYLHSRGVRSLPAPIAIDVEAHCAVYEFLGGEPASLRTPSDDDVQQAVGLLADLEAVARRSDADVAEAASDACFSIAAVTDHVRGRVNCLLALPDETPAVSALHGFLTGRLDPFVASLAEWTATQVRVGGLRPDADLPFAQRTLSPSDVGFHNAIRRDDGRLAFVDFEYFGWDDPAKTLSDFLLQPTEMSERQRCAFARSALAVFADQPHLPSRARIVYPWFGLKWCLILLNEFSPAHVRRRRFAGAVESPGPDLLRRQLGRAERLFDRIVGEYRENPYFDR
jgi:phosphotransferase family enzyme